MAFIGPTSAAVQITGAITTSPTIPQPTATQTLKHIVFQGTGAPATVISPSAGKKAYITCIYCMNTGSAALFQFNKADDATKLLMLQTAAANTGVIYNPGMPFIILDQASGELLRCSFPNNSWVTASYFEV